MTDTGLMTPTLSTTTTTEDERDTAVQEGTTSNRNRQIDVALIEDQQVLAGAIQVSLESLPDLRFVGSASTLADGEKLVRSTVPDVVVCDYRLSDGDIPDHLSRLLAVAPEVKALVFTGWPDENSLLEAMGAGARGFIDKASPFTEFVSAIRRVAAGEIVVSPRFLPALTRRATEQQPTSLSRRELEVLQLLAEGCNTEEMARRMILSIHTVRNHIARLMNKLDARSRLEAVNVGVRNGLIRYDPPSS